MNEDICERVGRAYGYAGRVGQPSCVFGADAAVAEIVETNGWTQAEAADRCGVTQPRINDLLRGRISLFSLDALVNIAAALGRKITVKVEDAA